MLPAMKKKGPAPVPIRAGNFEFLKINSAGRNWRDTYHWLLTLNWLEFSLCVSGLYLSINCFFAALYFLGGSAAIAELPAGSFSNAFFFSVETLATVGYGHMYPVSFYGHLVVTAEIIVGMFGMAVITGLIFVRFSRPTANLEFSRTMVFSTFKGQPALMFRIANQRRQPMVEAAFRLMLLRTESVPEDDDMRLFYELRLQMDRVIVFPAAMTIRHIIDEQSPLYGLTLESLERGDVRLIASIVCVDSVVAAAVQSQHDYTWRDIRFDERFVEIYTEDEAGRFVVDYGLLHETEPAPLPRNA